MIVGTVAALFEFLTDKKSEVDWDLAADGDLTVNVMPAG
jgi:hypothetical protein